MPHVTNPDAHTGNLRDEVEIELSERYKNSNLSEAAWNRICDEEIARRREEGRLRNKRGRGRGKN